jgi:hypothetical protein
MDDKNLSKNILNKKKYFDNELDDLFNLISFNRNNMRILGSYDYRAFYFPADIDIIENININNLSLKLTTFIKQLQYNIKKINQSNNIFINDIKMGNINIWNIIDESAYINNNNIYGYDQNKSKNKLKELYNNNIINKEEYNKWNKLLIKKPNQEQLNNIKKEIRPGLLRWKIKDIINGYIIHRGFKITIKEAINSGGLCKFDFIFIRTNNTIIDINIVYNILIKGLKNNNSPLFNPKRELLNEINTLKIKGDNFKAIKRLFSYYKLTNQKLKIVKLYKILNSDLGILHQISSNIELLINLLSNHKLSLKNKDSIDIYINNFIDRLNNIFQLKEYFKYEKFIINKINKIISIKTNTNKINKLNKLKIKIDNIKNNGSKKYIKIIEDL